MCGCLALCQTLSLTLPFSPFLSLFASSSLSSSLLFSLLVVLREKMGVWVSDTVRKYNKKIQQENTTNSLAHSTVLQQYFGTKQKEKKRFYFERQFNTQPISPHSSAAAMLRHKAKRGEKRFFLNDNKPTLQCPSNA